MHRSFAFGLLLICLACLAYRDVRMERRTAPPGTVAINDTLFADKEELSNLGWREFIVWLYRHDSTRVAAMLPDSNYGLNDYYYSDFEVKRSLFFTDSAFNFLPVTGISYEQALAYCAWRSDRVNELIRTRNERGRWAFRSVRYRLPTEAEWELAASGGLNSSAYPFGIRDTGGSLKQFTNCNPPVPGWDYRGGPMRTDSLRPNASGLYFTIGNVAEMLAEKGVAKGGYYALPVDSCRISSRQRYDGPGDWLGLRCVATVER